MPLYISIPVFILGNYILVKMYKKDMDPDKSKLAYVLQTIAFLLVFLFAVGAGYEILELIGVYGETTWIVIIGLIAIEYGVYKIAVNSEKELPKVKEDTVSKKNPIKEEQADIERELKEKNEYIARLKNDMQNYNITDYHAEYNRFKLFLDKFDFSEYWYKRKKEQLYYEEYNRCIDYDGDCLKELYLYYKNYEQLRPIIEKVMRLNKIECFDFDMYVDEGIKQYCYFVEYPLEYQKVKLFILKNKIKIHEKLLHKLPVDIVLNFVEKDPYRNGYRKVKSNWSLDIQCDSSYILNYGNKYKINFDNRIYDDLRERLELTEKYEICFMFRTIKGASTPTMILHHGDEIEYNEEIAYIFNNYGIKLKAVILDESGKIVYTDRLA